MILFPKTGKEEQVEVSLYTYLKVFCYSVHENISISNDIIESLFLEIQVPGGKNVIVGVVHRPPSSSGNDFIIYLSDLLRSTRFINGDYF